MGRQRATTRIQIVQQYRPRLSADMLLCSAKNLLGKHARCLSHMPVRFTRVVQKLYRCKCHHTHPFDDLLYQSESRTALIPCCCCRKASPTPGKHEARENTCFGILSLIFSRRFDTLMNSIFIFWNRSLF